MDEESPPPRHGWRDEGAGIATEPSQSRTPSGDHIAPPCPGYATAASASASDRS